MMDDISDPYLYFYFLLSEQKCISIQRLYLISNQVASFLIEFDISLYIQNSSLSDIQSFFPVVTYLCANRNLKNTIYQLFYSFITLLRNIGPMLDHKYFLSFFLPEVWASYLVPQPILC